MSNNGNERLLISLYNYSSITNGVWRSQSVLLEGESASNVSVSLVTLSIDIKLILIVVSPLCAVGVLRLLRHRKRGCCCHRRFAIFVSTVDSHIVFLDDNV